MKTTFLSRITLAGLLLSAAVASGTALAQGPAPVQSAPAAHHVVHRHGHAHHVKHHHKAHHKMHKGHKHQRHAK